MAVVNSDTEICNLALDECGATNINTRNDDTAEARICNRQYPIVRDEALRSHNWNFATKTVALTLTTTTTPGFASTFQLPDDYLKMVKLSESWYPYKIQGDKLVTDMTSVTIEYIARITDVSKFDALFVNYLVLLLASKMIYKFNQSINAKSEIKAGAKEALGNARTADGQEGTMDILQQTQWEQSRYSGVIEGDY